MSNATEQALAAARRPRGLTIDGVRYLVPPPTVAQAVEARAALAELGSGGEDARVALDDLLREWLPAGLPDALADMEHADLVSLLIVLLDAGVPTRSEPKGAEESEKQEPPPDLMLLLADYSAAFGGDVWTNYTRVAWPFFLCGIERINAAAARAVLRQVEADLLPHMGKGAQKAIKDLQRRAKGQTADVASADRETIQRERAALKRAMAGG